MPGRVQFLLISFLALPSLASAQAVQLPTFRYTTINTTVSVPDRGGLYLGGANRSASASTSSRAPLLGKAPGLGPLGRGRGTSHAASASAASVHATIIDHRELDRQVLAEVARRRLASGIPMSDPDVERRAEFLTRNIGRSARLISEPLTASDGSRPRAEELRQHNAEAPRSREQEAVTLYEKGRTALSVGKRGAARVYFNMAARRASGGLKRQLDEVLAELSGTPSRAAVASSGSLTPK